MTRRNSVGSDPGGVDPADLDPAEIDADIDPAGIDPAGIDPAEIDTVVFDLGGVVLRWDPHAAFAQELPADEIEPFLAEISFADWNRSQDGGRGWAEGENELIGRLPHREQAIRAYRRHFALTIPGMVPGTAGLIARLAAAGVRLLALTNWAADTFAETRSRFDLLGRFESIMVSGEEQLAKPDPAIFARLIERNRLTPGRTLFVDDAAANCAAAAGLGLRTHTFTDAESLGPDLIARGLLEAYQPPQGEVFHLADRSAWHRAQAGEGYPWSSRGLGYQQAGFVHCSFGPQLSGVRQRHLGDVADADLALLRLATDRVDGPIVVEGDGGFPHLFAPLRTSDVAEVLDWSDLGPRHLG